MLEKFQTEAEAGYHLAKKPEVTTIEGVPVLLMPEGYSKELMTALLPCPTRKIGTITISDVDSFIDVTKRFGSLSNCNIYLDVDYAKQHIQATSIFNDHHDSGAGWRDHRAVFSPKLSEEWTRWMGKDKQALEQVKLAHFLEENIGDIAQVEGMPTGSDVLTFVSALQETRKVKYGSAINLQNGMVELQFIEEGDNGTKGKLEAFRQFAIGIRPFANGDAYQVKAFLRYRIDRNTGGITFWFELQRPDRILEDASRAMVDKIKTTTGLPVIFGKP